MTGRAGIRVTVALSAILVSTFDARSVQDSPDEASTLNEITALETVWNEAHLDGDVDALDRLWAPSLTVIVPGMRPLRKEELLDMWRSMKVVFTDYATSELEVTVHGGTAVVTGRLRRSRDFAGRLATERWLFTKTYARIDGTWRVVSYHASEEPER